MIILISANDSKTVAMRLSVKLALEFKVNHIFLGKHVLFEKKYPVSKMFLISVFRTNGFKSRTFL